MALTTVSPGLLDTTAQYYGFKNRLVNGIYKHRWLGLTRLTRTDHDNHI
jgi:hypothetical protein